MLDIHRTIQIYYIALKAALTLHYCTTESFTNMGPLEYSIDLNIPDLHAFHNPSYKSLAPASGITDNHKGFAAKNLKRLICQFPPMRSKR